MKRRIITTLIVLVLGTSVTLPAAAAAAGAGVSAKDARNDVQRELGAGEVVLDNHPIDMKSVRFVYRKARLTAEVKFHTLTKTSWDIATIAIRVKGSAEPDWDYVDFQRQGPAVFKGNDGSISTDCPITLKVRAKIKRMTMSVDSACFGSPDVIEQVVFAVTALPDDGARYDVLDDPVRVMRR
jgi:hypothetical protein